jgi:hypothetical protein
MSRHKFCLGVTIIDTFQYPKHIIPYENHSPKRFKRATDPTDLQCEQRPLIVDVPLDVAALLVEGLHVLPDVSEVLIPAPGVDDEVDVLVVHLGDDGVADGAALLISEDREGAGAVLEAHDVGDDEGLEEGDGLAAHEAEAAHVGARWEELEGGDGESDGVLVRRRGGALLPRGPPSG